LDCPAFKYGRIVLDDWEVGLHVLAYVSHHYIGVCKHIYTHTRWLHIFARAVYGCLDSARSPSVLFEERGWLHVGPVTI
jgi:hypothetical protein